MSILLPSESEISFKVTMSGVDSFISKVSGVFEILKVGAGTLM